MAIGLSLATMISCSKEDASHIEDPATSSEVAQTLSEPIPGQYIVVFKEAGTVKGDPAQNKKAVQNKAQELLRENLISDAEILRVYEAAISGAALKMSADQAALLAKSDDVAFVEQDRLITLGKPSWAGGGDSGSTGEEIPYGVTYVNGGTRPLGSGVAWVIDTGIDLDHPDLNVKTKDDLGKIIAFTAFTSGRDANFDDGNGHGSHVAGTIAAIDNEQGVIGVAAGAPVIPVKVLDSRGSGSYSGVIEGVNHVAANGKEGDVANMSLGGPVSVALDSAVVAASRQGIKFTLAAGNDSDDAMNYSPARAEDPDREGYIYTISAVDNQYRFASFSNYGTPVDYAAPGVSVKSTWKDGGYNTISGTSMAAPHAAGVLLLGEAKTSTTEISGDVKDDTVDPFITH